MRLSQKVCFDIPYKEHRIRVEVTQLNHVSIYLNETLEYKKRFISGGLRQDFQWFGRKFTVSLKPIGFIIMPGIICTVSIDSQTYYEEELGFDKFGDNSNFKKMRHGIWFYFNIGDDTIAFHNSLTNGMETVYLNDKEISSERNLFSFTGTHEVPIAGQSYTLIVKVVNMLSGKVICELHKDGLLLETQTGGFTFSDNSNQKNAKEMLASFLVSLATFAAIGGIFGFFLGMGLAL